MNKFEQMRIEEFRKFYAEKKKSNKRHADHEHQLQVSCVQWFNRQYPSYQGLLFAVPNGGQRDIRVATKLKAEGVVPGVSDLILLRPNRHYAALLIEMKTSKGQQSEYQKKWQQLVTSEGFYQYIVCRSLDDFTQQISQYLNNGQE